VKSLGENKKVVSREGWAFFFTTFHPTKHNNVLLKVFTGPLHMQLSLLEHFLFFPPHYGQFLFSFQTSVLVLLYQSWPLTSGHFRFSPSLSFIALVLVLYFCLLLPLDYKPKRETCLFILIIIVFQSVACCIAHSRWPIFI
jgi:hypothetical protein